MMMTTMKKITSSTTTTITFLFFMTISLLLPFPPSQQRLKHLFHGCSLFIIPVDALLLSSSKATKVSIFQRRHIHHHHVHNKGVLAFQSNYKNVNQKNTVDTQSEYHSSSTELNHDENKISLSSTHPYINEIQNALSAIRKASRITSYLQPMTTNDSVLGINKKDASPVTIGDFAVQALVLKLLQQHFENDIFVAEESSLNLCMNADTDSSSGDDNSNDNNGDELSLEILNVMNECGFDDIFHTIDELKRSIDIGQTYDTQSGKIIITKDNNTTSTLQRVWCLDPIDGTRGFLRGKREGGQYCIALALIEDGIPVVGILACPNLPVSSSDHNYAWSDEETPENNINSRGCIIVASKNGGCYQLPLFPPPSQNINDHDNDSSTLGCQRIHVTENNGKGNIPLSKARFCIGVEKYSDPDGRISSIAKSIHGELNDDGDILYSVRMDSQVKYGVLARGGAEIFARLPKKSYVEWIWDHAPGRVVIEEAGGIQTDTNGNLIDYGLGAKMANDVDGIIASSGGIFHNALVNSLKTENK